MATTVTILAFLTSLCSPLQSSRSGKDDETASTRARSVSPFLGVDDDDRQKNPVAALRIDIQANQPHDVVDDLPGAPAELINMLRARLAEIDDDR